jgi:acyl-CoA thioester hydrolase
MAMARQVSTSRRGDAPSRFAASVSACQDAPVPPAVHEHRLRVRYGETDQMGVVHHANYLLYMEEGRTRMMEARGCSYAELERSGWGLVIRKVAMRFRAPARYDEELAVLTSVERVGGASVEFHYRVQRVATGELLLDGTTELACVELESPERKVTLLPDHLRALLES